jgi:hypothetical protein
MNAMILLDRTVQASSFTTEPSTNHPSYMAVSVSLTWSLFAEDVLQPWVTQNVTVL